MIRRATLALAIVLSACSSRSFDVGQNDASITTPASTPPGRSVAPSQYGCVDVTDDELTRMRGRACTGACSDGIDDPYDVATQQQLVASTIGQWLYCGSAPALFGPRDAVGIEFAPGCRIFFLRRDFSGAIVRGTEAAYQTRFDIYDLRDRDAPRRIDLEFPAMKVALDVRVSRCPNRLELRSTDGRTVELGSDFGDAGRPDPVK